MIFNNQSSYFKDGVVNFENVKFQDLIPPNFDKDFQQILIARPNAEEISSILSIDPEGFDSGDYLLELLGYTFAIAIGEVVPRWKSGDPISNIEITFIEILEPDSQCLRVKLCITFTIEGNEYSYGST